MGFVITTTIEWEGEKVMHASDVQGPIYEGSKRLIIDENPDMVILSGPPTYLEGFAIEPEDIKKAQDNLIEIAREIPEWLWIIIY